MPYIANYVQRRARLSFALLHALRRMLSRIINYIAQEDFCNLQASPWFFFCYKVYYKGGNLAGELIIIYESLIIATAVDIIIYNFYAKQWVVVFYCSSIIY